MASSNANTGLQICQSVKLPSQSHNRSTKLSRTNDRWVFQLIRQQFSINLTSTTFPADITTQSLSYQVNFLAECEQSHAALLQSTCYLTSDSLIFMPHAIFWMFLPHPPQNLYIEALTPNLMLLAGTPYHGGRDIVIGISALIKQTSEIWLVPSRWEVTLKQLPVKQPVAWHPTF